MKKVSLLALVVFTLSCLNVSLVNAEDNKWTRLVEESGKVLKETQQMPEKGIPEDLLKKCHAIAIFPSTVSAGFVIGGKYGQGIIMARDPKTNGWSAPALFTIGGGSFGLQIGGQATDIVLLIMGSRSVDAILSGKFKLGADASVAAGPVGRTAEASTDVQLKGGILSYSRSRGLFAGVKLEGAVIAFHKDGNKELYGEKLTGREIVLENKAKMPESANELLSILNQYPAVK